MRLLNIIFSPIRKIGGLTRRIPGLIAVHRIPMDSLIRYPFQIRGGRNIEVGNDTTINKYAWLDALPVTGCDTVELRIGNRVRIAFNLHIIASHRIIIGDNVNMANAVYISDNSHGYEDINLAPRDQPVKQLNDVIIGEDSWIGEHVVILGVSIGKHCVIGSNSVVTHDVPDYCVVAGAPARIIKRYDFIENRWRKTDKKGCFISSES